MPEVQSPNANVQPPTVPWPLDLTDLANQIHEFMLKYHHEDISWCENRTTLDKMSDADVYCEYAHVIYCSGFRASTIASKWSLLRLAWHNFDSRRVYEDKDGCFERAMLIFGNKRKNRHIVEMAEHVQGIGWPVVRRVQLSTVDSMEGLPGIGPTLKYHLARNLGHEVVKPDIHLERIRSHYGYFSSKDFCIEMQSRFPASLRLGTIDCCVWRYASEVGTNNL